MPLLGDFNGRAGIFRPDDIPLNMVARCCPTPEVFVPTSMDMYLPYFDQLKGGCVSITPLSLLNYLNQGFNRGNFPIKNCGLTLIIGKNTG